MDTHLDLNVAVALDKLGRRLGVLKVPTTTRGYERLLRWTQGFGSVGCAGIEGTSSYWAGLARYLRASGISVMEVERPKRSHLRRNGESDPIDAEAAARAGNRPAKSSHDRRYTYPTRGWTESGRTSAALR